MKNKLAKNSSDALPRLHLVIQPKLSHSAGHEKLLLWMIIVILHLSDLSHLTTTSAVCVRSSQMPVETAYMLLLYASRLGT